ncbi:MAG: ABC transporter permease [Armatimonadetes bacterium]|nr:ABC transporter permease [Armatimonadota bacterium]
MIDELRELFKYKDLVKQLVIRDLKVRYKNSVLGFFWSLLNPLIQVATITIVVKYILALDIANYSAYLLVGYLPWVFFQMALLDSSDVIILHHRDLLKKVYFPREVLPLSSVIANLIHFGLALVVFFAYLLFYYFFLHGSPIMPTVLWLPVLIVMQTLLITGLAFFLSCMNMFFEDTKYVLTVLLNVFFYLTPVMYVAELVFTKIPEAHRGLLYKLYLLNPLNMLTDAYRKILLPPFHATRMRGEEISSLPLDYAMLGVCAVVCLLVAIAGYRFFNARKWQFAERV